MAHRLRHLRSASIFVVLALHACRPDGSSEHGAGVLPSDSAIRALIAEHVEATGVGMVVGVVDALGRRVISYGVSGAMSGRPVDGESVFQLGSVTKPITTLLLAEMVVRGEVGLDDVIQDYLPADVELPPTHRQITLRQLATHTSGLPSMPSNLDVRGTPDPYAAYSVADLWSYLASSELRNPPGTEYLYSNLGVSLLGRLLALRQGTSYESLVRERVLDPLGMDDTSISLDADQRARRVEGHGPYRAPVRTWEMETLQASGSLRSTAADMLLLLEAYLGKRDTELEEAIAIQLTGGGQEARGPLSWGQLDDGTFRHAGGKAGYRSGVAFNTTTGVGAVVLANTRTYESIPIQIAIHLVAGAPAPEVEPAPPPKPVVEMTEHALEAFEGTYVLAGGGMIEVVRNGTHLLARYENNSVWEFAALGPHAFFLTTGNDDLIFQTDDGGAVIGVTRYGDGAATGEGEYARRISDPDVQM